jgi:long-chain acyl-CoA synthetase
MAQSGAEPAWLQAEREFDDELREWGSIPDLFEESARRHADRDAQLYKGGVYERSLRGPIPAAPPGEFAAITYGELRSIVRRLTAGFRSLGLGSGDRVAIFANTRMEWAQSDLALLAAGCTVTTVYTESSPERVEYLLDDPEAKAAVVENERLLDRVLAVEDDLDLETIVLMDDPREPRKRDDILTLGEVYDRGSETYDPETYREWLDEIDPDDLASLIYTSGTTGRPKGVRLTHWNFRSNFHQIRRRIGPRPDRVPDGPVIGPETTSISFLPLAHVFERLAGHYLMFGSGATVGYAEHPDTLADDLQKVRPTYGASVPRVYERIFDRMREQAGDGVKQRIFEWSLGVAREYQRADDPGPLLGVKHAIADRLVYSTVRENLGGRVEFMVSGGGSLSEDLCRVFNGMGVTVIEGYGLTETSPVVSVNPPEDIRPGTMGVPLVGNEIRIDEAKVGPSEFDDATGTVGELLVRGDNVSAGYWNNPGATERAFDEDGWFRTGDVVELTDDGYLRFRERLKQIMVLTTGKNVAPAPIEDGFATDDRVDQVMVLGDNRKFVSALIVPNFDALDRWAEQNDISLPADRAESVRDDRVRGWVQEAVDSVNQELGKNARVKKFELVPEEWTAENDLLTPSMKKKRRNIEEAYAEEIERIYGEEAVVAGESA